VTLVVGVVPGAESARRPRLLRALEQAFPLRFVDREPGDWNGLDGALVFGVRADAPDSLPCLVLEADTASTDGGLIDLGTSVDLDPLLRGRALRDEEEGGGRGVAVADGVVYASRERTPVWGRPAGSATELAAVPPPELGEDESLRDLLRPGRFLAALPLLHFLRRLTAADAWSLPPLRAAFQIDDPNLHWTSYGHISYPELARDATERNYHVAMAMVPLDGWYAHRGAVRLFRERADRLSLLMHGNDHVKSELGQRSVETGRRLVAQALRRIAAFERKSRLEVSRVMVAPHGECSDELMVAMGLTSVEALCIEWPYWWRRGREPLTGPLSGWEPGDFLVGGLPILPRHPMTSNTDELLFRALLGGPIVMTGHQDELAGGLDVLRSAAGFVNALGDVRWMSLGAIAASNYATRREGSTLRLRPYSRFVRAQVPDGVDTLVVELPSSHESTDQETLLIGGGARTVSPFAPTPVEPGAVDVRLWRIGAREADAIPAPAWRPWPLVRRVLVESRDRLSARL
jgi:hypothetical protein